MQPLERPMSVEIVDAEVVEDQSGSTLIICADDEDQVLRMEIRALDNDYQTNLRGQSALNYLLGELGMMDLDQPGELVSKRLHRWAWERVASIASLKIPLRPAPPLELAPTGDKIESGRFIYVISAETADQQLCKIGIANSPEKRIKTLSTSSPHALRLEFTRYSDDARAVERAAHAHFCESRWNGEWFAISAEQAIEHIIEATRSAS